MGPLACDAGTNGIFISTTLVISELTLHATIPWIAAGKVSVMVISLHTHHVQAQAGV